MRKSAGQRSDEQVKVEPQKTVELVLCQMDVHLAMLGDAIVELHRVTSPVRHPVSVQAPTPESTTTNVHLVDKLSYMDGRITTCMNDIGAIIGALALGNLGYNTDANS